jgi:hypothetical protein
MKVLVFDDEGKLRFMLELYYQSNPESLYAQDEVDNLIESIQRYATTEDK